MDYVARMATKPVHPGGRRLWLREHRKAAAISATKMAQALEMERESVYKLERNWERATARQQAIYAKEARIDPGALWSPPEGTVRTARLGPKGIESLTDDELDKLAARLSRRISPKK